MLCSLGVSHNWVFSPILQGVSGRKLIGSLTWLFHVQSTSTIGTPTAQLLHYPIPKKPIEGFSAHVRAVGLSSQTEFSSGGVGDHGNELYWRRARLSQEADRADGRDIYSKHVWQKYCAHSCMVGPRYFIV